MSSEIKDGDIVQLRSGGPKMTVTQVEEWNGKMRAKCDWFDAAASKYDYFPLTSLMHVDDRR